MEFTVNKNDIAQGLYKAQGVVERKSTLNILSHVLIESISNTEIRITSTDYDVLLTGTYAAEVVEPGRIAVGAKNMFDVIKALPDHPIHVAKLDNHWIELKCGSSRFKLAGLPADDFPESRLPEELKYLSTPKRLLLDMIDRTLFSVSQDETRPSLNGVFFRVVREENELRMVMVSTDGHRLSKSEALGGDAADFGKAAETILHHKAISELKRCLEGPEDDVRVAFHRGNVYFATDEVILQVRELDETFPDYAKVIPSSNKIEIDLGRQELMAAIRRIATLTSAKTHIIKLEFGGGRLLLTSQNPETGEGQDELEISYDGDDLSVGFNHKYLTQVLSVINGDRVVFGINDQYSPGLISSVDDEGSLFVIMPMRI